MKEVLSPKELAAAIGVSESSLKRWADKGEVKSTRTPGGHRRIPISEAIRFIRNSNVTIVKPELLGLSALPEDSGEDQADQLYSLLSEGQAREARGLLMAAFIQGQSLAELFDGPLKEALYRLGEIWKHDSQGIFVEHRATDICLEAIRELRFAIADDPSNPTAIGGAPSGDGYSIPSLMASTILMEENFHSVNLGGNTPLETLGSAARELDARLVWLSVTNPADERAFDEALSLLAQQCREERRGLAIGGQHRATRELARRHGIHFCEDMNGLASFARGIRSTLG
jgi:MerR family transcriptional regulator, light-induced transcriptional regulator